MELFPNCFQGIDEVRKAPFFLGFQRQLIRSSPFTRILACKCRRSEENPSEKSGGFFCFDINADIDERLFGTFFSKNMCENVIMNLDIGQT